MFVVIKGEVSNKIVALLSSATLVVLHKKDAETMEEMKRLLGDAYMQPHKPLGMGSTLVKLVSNCAMFLLKGNLGPAVGPSRFFVETKGGRDHMQWAL